MLMPRSELFDNLGESALEVMGGLSWEKTCDGRDLVFREGDEADTFYILVEGTVHLVMGEDEQLCFVVDRSGQVFGWSALIEPYRYRASARCLTPAKLIVIPREAVERVSVDYPADTIIIFTNLATIVTDKLQEVYRNVVSESDPWR
jgi:CRP-like cAMP-binding protein